MHSKYGFFGSTYNRKRIASVLFKKFPHMRERIAKQLKHSVQTEKTMYDIAMGGVERGHL